MTRSILAILPYLALAACGDAPDGTRADAPRVGVADLSDSATTAYGLARPGISEANPLLAWSGPAAPVLGLGVKYAAKSALVDQGMPAREANFHVERGSAIATCANVVTIAGAAAPPALMAGAFCGLAFTEAFRPAPAPPRVVVVPHEMVARMGGTRPAP